MSSEREEIRWKFQVLVDSMENVIQILQNERTGFLDYLEKYVHERREIRNTILGMTAFGIVLLVSLISIKILQEDLVWMIIPAMVGGSIVYLIVQRDVYSTALKIHKLNSKYLIIIDDMLKIKGFFTGLSLREDTQKELILKLIQYSFVMPQIFAYEGANYAHDIIKSPKPNQEIFRETYNTIKQNLDEIKEIGIEPLNYKFDLFLKEFEKNEKSKK